MAPGHQLSLPRGVPQPAQQYVFALPGVDLPEHRFHNRLAPSINRPTLLRLQPPRHPLGHRRTLRNPAPRRLRNRTPMLEPAGGNEERRLPGSLQGTDMFQIRCRAIPRVGTPPARHRVQSRGGVFDHQHRLLHVHRGVVQFGGHDHLVIGINNGLGVAAVVVGTISGLQDPRVRVCVIDCL